MDIHDFTQEAARFGVELSPSQYQQLETYCVELIAWNNTSNLTGITDRNDIFVKHFLDSLSLFQALPPHTKKLIDIGSGAGFPGLVLKIARPDLNITLIESIGKKAEFLNHMISTLLFTEIAVVQLRAEDTAHDPHYREQYDVATARAVAKLNILAEYALPFLKISGTFIAMKQKNNEELVEAGHALEVLGGTYINSLPVVLPGQHYTAEKERELIVILKDHLTPTAYPRRAGMPSKRPL